MGSLGEFMEDQSIRNIPVFLAQEIPEPQISRSWEDEAGKALAYASHFLSSSAKHLHRCVSTNRNLG